LRLLFSVQNSVKSLVNRGVCCLQLRSGLVGLGKNIMLTEKARTKRQEDKYDDSEKFAAVAYSLLPPAKCYFVLVLVQVLGRAVQGLCVRYLFLVEAWIWKAILRRRQSPLEAVGVMKA
jgi:hypothetical protein